MRSRQVLDSHFKFWGKLVDSLFESLRSAVEWRGLAKDILAVGARKSERSDWTRLVGKNCHDQRVITIHGNPWAEIGKTQYFRALGTYIALHSHSLTAQSVHFFRLEQNKKTAFILLITIKVQNQHDKHFTFIRTC